VRFYAIGLLSLGLLLLGHASAALAQSSEPSIALTVNAGRPLEVVLDKRVTIKRVGQPITGTLVEPIYAYDRIVVPAGTKVLGHVAALDGVSKLARTHAMLSGNFTPGRHVVMQFDELVPDSHDPIAITTRVTTEMPNLKRSTTPPPPADETKKPGVIGRAEREARDRVAAAKQGGRDVLAEITQPGRGARLKDALIQKLPAHPQTIGAGMGYQAELTAPIDFGRVSATTPASPHARPAPSSIIHAQLVTPLNSATTPRGTPMQAVVTVPVFSVDHALIYEEGTILEGEVTLAKPARRFHRNGQLRFLVERVRPIVGEGSPLLASLESVHGSGDDRLALDDEGGATATNSKTRFVAPALALLALRGNLDKHDHPDPDGDGHVINSGNPGALTVGGFMGLGLLGIPLSHMSPPFGVALSIVGAIRSVYRNVLGKGRDVQFPVHTVMQLELAPGSSQP
jgi:hypothetical protein